MIHYIICNWVSHSRADPTSLVLLLKEMAKGKGEATKDLTHLERLHLPGAELATK